MQTFIENFRLACTVIEKRYALIILLGGTSGTGKSTVASILASRFGVPTVLSTDSIRHIMRNFISKDDNPVLFASTYEAGKAIKLSAEEMKNMSETKYIIKG